VDLPSSDLAGTVATVEAAGRRGVTAAADVTEPDSVAAAVDAVEAALGPLRLAVNSAGIANAAPAEEMALEQFQTVLDVNVTAVFLSAQAEGRALLRNGGGAVVNIASMSGTIVNRGLLQAHYNASKAAVVHLSKSLAMEWADRGIRVNSISPGYTATPMNLRSEVAEQVASFGRRPDRRRRLRLLVSPPDRRSMTSRKGRRPRGKDRLGGAKWEPSTYTSS
jgi:NAD(P)-dependent dehydrogenase (short-subunit alcohol dehydrogenase family)